MSQAVALDYAYVHSYLAPPSPLGLGRGRLGRPRPGGVGSRVAALPCRVGAALGALGPLPPCRCGPVLGSRLWGGFPPPWGGPLLGLPWVGGLPPLGGALCGAPRSPGVWGPRQWRRQRRLSDRAEQSFAGLAQAI